MKDSQPKTKELLRASVLPAFWRSAPYVSVPDVRRALADAGARVQPATVNRYLHSLLQAGEVFDAGRGWYSSLAEPFVLDLAPVRALTDELAKAFPLVTFSCWSTEQVKGAMHHLLNRFVTFVYVEADVMENVFEHLRDAGWEAWLNPRGTEAARFAVRERTVVVRRESRKSPSRQPIAPIEKLLVELCFEARDLQVMAMSDFHAMLANLAGTHRIPMAALLSYASKRKLRLAELLGAKNQLTPPF